MQPGAKVDSDPFHGCPNASMSRNSRGLRGPIGTCWRSWSWGLNGSVAPPKAAPRCGRASLACSAPSVHACLGLKPSGCSPPPCVSPACIPRSITHAGHRLCPRCSALPPGSSAPSSGLGRSTGPPRQEGSPWAEGPWGRHARAGARRRGGGH